MTAHRLVLILCLGLTALPAMAARPAGAPARRAKPAPPTIEDLVAQGELYVGERDWEAAAGAWRRARKLAHGSADRELIKPLEEQLTQAGKDELELARQMFKDRAFVQALERYDWVARVFAQTPVGAQATRMLRAAAKDPSLRLPYQEVTARRLYAELDEMILEALREQMPQPAEGEPPASQPAFAAATQSAPAQLRGPQRVEAISQLKDADQLAAIQMLARISRECPDVPTGKLAGADLEALREAGVIHDVETPPGRAEARRLLQMADGLAGIDPAKAFEIYHQIIRDYPGTPEADQAQQRLNQGLRYDIQVRPANVTR